MTNSGMTTGSASDLAELAEVREELRAVARDLLGKAGAVAEPGWGQLAASGWLGLETPDELGGAGATFAEVAVIAEELGRAAARTPYLGAIVLGVGALLAVAPSGDRDALLAQVTAGEEIPVALVTEGAAFRLATQKNGGEERTVLHGYAPFLPDAAEARRLLVLAYRDGAGSDRADSTAGTAVVSGAGRADGTRGTPGADSTHGAGEPVLVVLSPGTPGLQKRPQPVLDETRNLAEVTADGVEVPPESVWRFAGDPHAAVRRLRNRAAVALACDSIGVAEAMLDATVSYAKVRHQFGRPIGSFQAVKHACADMLVQVTVARELTAAAVAALAEPRGATLAEETPASVAASMAKSYACAAAVDVAGKAMQLHGGVGYARDSGIHAYLKRAALSRDLFGSPAAHRARLAERYRQRTPETDHMDD